MKKFIALALSLAATGSLCAAGEKVSMTSPDDLAGSAASVKAVKAIPNGFSFAGTRFFRVWSKKVIKVDPAKKYRVSCEYRMAPGSAEAKGLYLGLVCRDAKGAILTSRGQYIINQSGTVLAADAKAGDRSVKVKDAAKWVVQWGHCAFGAKADLSDLPNNDLAKIARIEKKGDAWEVTFNQPLKKAYPAGTGVRCQRDGAEYRYLLGYVQAPGEWKKLTAVISGFARELAPGYGRAWRLGTAEGGLVVFTTVQSGSFEIRNLVLEAVEQK